MEYENEDENYNDDMELIEVGDDGVDDSVPEGYQEEEMIDIEEESMEVNMGVSDAETPQCYINVLQCKCEVESFFRSLYTPSEEPDHLLHELDIYDSKLKAGPDLIDISMGKTSLKDDSRFYAPIVSIPSETGGVYIDKLMQLIAKTSSEIKSKMTARAKSFFAAGFILSKVFYDYDEFDVAASDMRFGVAFESNLTISKWMYLSDAQDAINAVPKRALVVSKSKHIGFWKGYSGGLVLPSRQTSSKDIFEFPIYVLHCNPIRVEKGTNYTFVEARFANSLNLLPRPDDEPRIRHGLYREEDHSKEKDLSLKSLANRVNYALGLCALTMGDTWINFEVSEQTVSSRLDNLEVSIREALANAFKNTDSQKRRVMLPNNSSDASTTAVLVVPIKITADKLSLMHHERRFEAIEKNAIYLYLKLSDKLAVKASLKSYEPKFEFLEKKGADLTDLSDSQNSWWYQEAITSNQMESKKKIFLKPSLALDSDWESEFFSSASHHLSNSKNENESSLSATLFIDSFVSTISKVRFGSSDLTDTMMRSLIKSQAIRKLNNYPWEILGDVIPNNSNQRSKRSSPSAQSKDSSSTEGALVLKKSLLEDVRKLNSSIHAFEKLYVNPAMKASSESISSLSDLPSLACFDSVSSRKSKRNNEIKYSLYLGQADTESLQQQLNQYVIIVDAFSKRIAAAESEKPAEILFRFDDAGASVLPKEILGSSFWYTTVPQAKETVPKAKPSVVTPRSKTTSSSSSSSSKKPKTATGSIIASRIYSYPNKNLFVSTAPRIGVKAKEIPLDHRELNELYGLAQPMNLNDFFRTANDSQGDANDDEVIDIENTDLGWNEAVDPNSTQEDATMIDLSSMLNNEDEEVESATPDTPYIDGVPRYNPSDPSGKPSPPSSPSWAASQPYRDDYTPLRYTSDYETDSPVAETHYDYNQYEKKKEEEARKGKGKEEEKEPNDKTPEVSPNTTPVLRRANAVSLHNSNDKNNSSSSSSSNSNSNTYRTASNKPTVPTVYNPLATQTTSTSSNTTNKNPPIDLTSNSTTTTTPMDLSNENSQSRKRVRKDDPNRNFVDAILDDIEKKIDEAVEKRAERRLEATALAFRQLIENARQIRLEKFDKSQKIIYDWTETNAPRVYAYIRKVSQTPASYNKDEASDIINQSARTYSESVVTRTKGVLNRNLNAPFMMERLNKVPALALPIPETFVKLQDTLSSGAKFTLGDYATGLREWYDALEGRYKLMSELNLRLTATKEKVKLDIKNHLSDAIPMMLTQTGAPNTRQPFGFPPLNVDWIDLPDVDRDGSSLSSLKSELAQAEVESYALEIELKTYVALKTIIQNLASSVVIKKKGTAKDNIALGDVYKQLQAQAEMKAESDRKSIVKRVNAAFDIDREISTKNVTDLATKLENFTTYYHKLMAQIAPGVITEDAGSKDTALMLIKQTKKYISDLESAVTKAKEEIKGAVEQEMIIKKSELTEYERKIKEYRQVALASSTDLITLFNNMNIELANRDTKMDGKFQSDYEKYKLKFEGLKEEARKLDIQVASAESEQKQPPLVYYGLSKISTYPYDYLKTTLPNFKKTIQPFLDTLEGIFNSKSSGASGKNKATDPTATAGSSSSVSSTAPKGVSNVHRHVAQKLHTYLTSEVNKAGTDLKEGTGLAQARMAYEVTHSIARTVIGDNVRFPVTNPKASVGIFGMEGKNFEDLKWKTEFPALADLLKALVALYVKPENEALKVHDHVNQKTTTRYNDGLVSDHVKLLQKKTLDIEAIVKGMFTMFNSPNSNLEANIAKARLEASEAAKQISNAFQKMDSTGESLVINMWKWFMQNYGTAPNNIPFEWVYLFKLAEIGKYLLGGNYQNIFLPAAVPANAPSVIVIPTRKLESDKADVTNYMKLLCDTIENSMATYRNIRNEIQKMTSNFAD